MRPGIADMAASPSKSSAHTSFLDSLTKDSTNKPINSAFKTLKVVWNMART